MAKKKNIAEKDMMENNVEEKKEEGTLEERIGEQSADSGTFNPLIAALRENDRKNLFSTNVTTAFLKTGFPLFDYYFGSVVNIHNELGEIIEQQPRVGQAAGTFNMLIGASSSGKLEPNFRKLPTCHGYTSMGDIKVNDIVFNRHGNQVKVLAVYPQGVKDIYKITFEDGRYALCGEEHLWGILDSNNNLHTATAKEIRDNLKNRKFRIPALNKSVSYSDKHTKANARTEDWLLGYDGEKIDWNSADLYIKKEFKYDIASTRMNLLMELTKYIGEVEFATNMTKFTTFSKQLAYDIREIILGLGFLCKYEGNMMEGTYTVKSSGKRVDSLEIVNVEYYGKEECTCIKVDDPEGLYLTEDRTLHHELR